MQTQANTVVSSLVSLLSTANFIGTWKRDLTADHIVLDSGAAATVAGNINLSGQPISLTSALRCVHPDDLTWVVPKIETVSRTGGLFVADYRVQTSNGQKRLLDHGSIFEAEDGSLHGFGILLDITHVGKLPFVGGKEKIPVPQGDIFSALEALQSGLAGPSVRARVLLDMLRIEIERSGIRV